MEEVTARSSGLAPRPGDARDRHRGGRARRSAPGHDLGEMVGRDLAFYQRVFDACTRLMDAIHDVPQPVIARVHGIATAAGCQLVAACDLAVAGRAARFATPGVRIGLFCSTPMVPLSRAIGRKRALADAPHRRRRSTPRRRCDWGLVNRVVPAEALDDDGRRASSRASPGRAASPSAIGKEAFYAQIDLDEPRATTSRRP